MDKSYVIDDIIRYIYKETDKDENRKIKFNIARDKELKDEHKHLTKTCKFLDYLKTSPCSEVVKNILGHANKSSNLEPKS